MTCFGLGNAEGRKVSFFLKRKDFLLSQQESAICNCLGVKDRFIQNQKYLLLMRENNHVLVAFTEPHIYLPHINRYSIHDNMQVISPFFFIKQ